MLRFLAQLDELLIYVGQNGVYESIWMLTRLHKL